MKVVDIADELFREISEDSNYSIASISYWVRANIGRLNSHINTFFEIKSSTLEIVQSTDEKNDNVLVESEITIDEAAILKKMFLIYFYDRTIRTNIANASSDTIVQVTDQGSTVRKINKNEVIKSLTSLKRQEYTEDILRKKQLVVLVVFLVVLGVVWVVLGVVFLAQVPAVALPLLLPVLKPPPGPPKPPPGPPKTPPGPPIIF